MSENVLLLLGDEHTNFVKSGRFPITGALQGKKLIKVLLCKFKKLLTLSL